tara:strand:+ start:3240 stop:4145 length:906 start_codon:yes stop_codon:yes gene_type:complete
MHLAGVGFSVGENKIRVSDLFDDPRLIERTGIEYVYETEGTTSSLVLNAVKNLGSYSLSQIEACILVTQSPDDVLPANSIPLASQIGLSNSLIAFDINQGCSGFVQSLCLMDSLIQKYSTIMLLTGDRYRSKLAKSDRSTGAVFSDGASASVWTSNGPDHILYESHITDGNKRDWLYQANNSIHEESCLHMSGAEIWMFTKSLVVPEIKKAIQFCLDRDLQITGFYMHQASKVVVEGICKEMPKSVQKVTPKNYNLFGNTVSSTIPILLKQHPMSHGKKKVTVFAGFGVGLSASTAVFGQE